MLRCFRARLQCLPQRRDLPERRDCFRQLGKHVQPSVAAAPCLVKAVANRKPAERRLDASVQAVSSTLPRVIARQSDIGHPLPHRCSTVSDDRQDHRILQRLGVHQLLDGAGDELSIFASAAKVNHAITLLHRPEAPLPRLSNAPNHPRHSPSQKCAATDISPAVDRQSNSLSLASSLTVILQHKSVDEPQSWDSTCDDSAGSLRPPATL